MAETTRLGRRLAGDIAVYGIVGVARHLTSFAFLPIYLHILNKNEFGALDIMITVVSFVNLLVLQFNVGYARYYYRERSPKEQANYIKTMFYFFSVCGLVIAVFIGPLGYIVGAYLLNGVPKGAISVAVAVVSIMPQVIVEFALINMRLTRKHAYFGVMSVADSIFRGIFIIIFICSLKMGLFGYALGMVLASSLICVAALRFLRQLCAKGQFVIGQFKEIGKFTYPTLPGVLLNYANQYGGRFILLMFLSLEEIALYALAMKLAKIVKMCVHSFRQAWLPAAMEQIYNPEGTVFYARIFDMYALVTVGILMLLSLFAKPIIKIIAPEGYLAASVLVPYLVAGVLIGAASAIVDIGNQIAEQTKWISIATGFGCIVNLGVAIMFTPRFGSLAVAAGFMLSAVVFVAVLFFASLHNHKIPYRWHSLAVMIVGIPGFVLLFFH